MRTRNVYIVEDNELICEGYEALLGMEPDLTVCGRAASVQEALAHLEATDDIDVVVVDMRLNHDLDGVDLIEQLHATRPDVPAVAVTAHVQPSYRERAMEAGAQRFLDKKEAAAKLVPLLRELLGA